MAHIMDTYINSATKAMEGILRMETLTTTIQTQRASPGREHAHVQELSTRVRELDEFLHTMKNTLHTEEMQSGMKKTEYEHLCLQTDELQKMFTASRCNVKNQVPELELCAATLKVEELMEEVSSLKKEGQRHHMQREEESATATKARTKLQQHLCSLEGEKNQLESALELVQTECSVAQSKVVAVEKELEQSKQDMLRLTQGFCEKAIDLRGEVAAAEQLKDQLQDEVGTLTAENQRLSQETQELQDSFASCKQELEATKMEVVSLKAEERSRRTDYGAATRANKELGEEISKLQQQATALRAEIRQSHESSREMIAERDSMRAELQKTKKQSNSDIEALKARVVQLLLAQPVAMKTGDGSTSGTQSPVSDTSDYIPPKPSTAITNGGAAETPRPRGLVNLGNTCYLNTALQCLVSLPQIRQYFAKEQRSGPSKVMTELGSLIRSLCTTATTTTTTATLKKKKKKKGKNVYQMPPRAVDPSAFKNAFLERDSNAQFVGGDESDSHEFMRSLLSGIHEDFKDLDDEYPPSDIFQGQTLSNRECVSCRTTFSNVENFMDLSLPVSASDTSLENCLEAYLADEVLEGECSHCHSRKGFVKKLSLSRLPPVLMLHLNRTQWCRHRGHLIKRTQEIAFPTRSLDVGSHTAEWLNERDTVYDLCAVAHHQGTDSTSGHYTADVVHQGQWFNVNDGVVKDSQKIDPSTAYILVYSRQPTGV
eukprot:GFYU01006003.1.p1 GENE.GFYU01006003.1~~GFYU01006003.1.p1  ORF type:complete len:715 (-),score=159.67 GFYU01006003.1:251-2395(-)